MTASVVSEPKRSRSCRLFRAAEPLWRPADRTVSEDSVHRMVCDVGHHISVPMCPLKFAGVRTCPLRPVGS